MVQLAVRVFEPQHCKRGARHASGVLAVCSAACMPVASRLEQLVGTISTAHKLGPVMLVAVLQVPQAFLEEFPGALYAAEIRHRKSVSLGRHVVCRATLQPLSEHQLSGLAAMARAQLVALCMLQTAELHMVPYFDNKNHVRCVGFLKIKAT